MAATEQDVRSAIAEPQRRYTDDELVGIVDRIVEQSPSTTGGRADDRQELAYDYYYGRLPGAAGVNTSDYVSWEVYESVEAAKAKLLKTFASNRSVVRWRPTDEKNVEIACQRTKAVNAIIDGSSGRSFKILHDIFHDGLMSGLACVKRVYRTRQVATVRRFDGVPLEQLQAAAMRDEVDTIEVESERFVNQTVPTPMGPARYRQRVASGAVTVLEDRSGIDIEVIPPEDVHFSDDVCDLYDVEKIPAVGVTYRRTKYQLLEDGIDPEVVEGLFRSNDITRLGKNARRQSGTSFGEDSAVNEGECVDVDEAYVWLDMHTPKGEAPRRATLWQIIKSGGELLATEQIEEIPLRFWTPYPVAHVATGPSLSLITMDLQASVTAAVRGVIDNVHRVNAGLRTANLSLIKNPGDLLDNPIGGVIDTDRPNDAINVVPQPSISPATMGLFEVLNVQKEQRTGASRMARGLNSQDVITHQNAADMIDRLIDLGGERDMTMARGFAELFWRPLMIDIYRLAVENKVTVKIEYEGREIPVDLSQLPYSESMQVDVALTPDYGDQQARKLLTTHQLLSQDQMLAPLYTMEERYALMSEVLHLLGQPNWLANPKDPAVAQRLQLQQQQQRAAQQAALQQQQVKDQREERLVRVQEQRAMADAKLKKEDLDLDSAKSATAQSLKEREFLWEQQVDIAELGLESRQQRAVAIGAGNGA